MSDPAARAFTERQRKRTGQRDELRDTHQRLQLGATLRGELHHLADDAARIAGYAEGNLPGLAERATVQLAGRRAYAARLYDTAQRFEVLDALRLAELDPDDLAALGLPAAAESP